MELNKSKDNPNCESEETIDLDETCQYEIENDAKRYYKNYFFTILFR